MSILMITSSFVTIKAALTEEANQATTGPVENENLSSKCRNWVLHSFEKDSSPAKLTLARLKMINCEQCGRQSGEVRQWESTGPAGPNGEVLQHPGCGIGAVLLLRTKFEVLFFCSSGKKVGCAASGTYLITKHRRLHRMAVCGSQKTGCTYP